MASGPRSKKKKASGLPVKTRRGIAGATAKTATWRRVADRLEKDIAAGAFRSTGRLPTEALLAAELAVGRHTLRAAIAELVKRGVLRNLSYQGVFIAPRRVEFVIGARTRFFDALVKAGFTYGRRILSRRLCSPPVEVAKLLGVAQRTQVVEIVQVLSANDVPLACSTLWMPADRFGRVVDLLEPAGGLRRAFAQAGVNDYRRKLVRITSSPAASDDRRSLNLKSGAPVVGMFGVSVDEADEPTHAFDYRFDAHRIAFVVET